MNVKTLDPGATVTSTPAAEWNIDAALVRALLRTQHPDLAHLDIEPFGSGWDNAMFRLGADLLVRLPRREVAEGLIENEQRWLPVLAPRLTLPVPAPVRVGVASEHFPWRWSVLPYLPGIAADAAPVDTDEAERLADFLRALHQPAPAEAPRNPVRGVPLEKRAAVTEERLVRLEQKTALITQETYDAWRGGLAAPSATTDTWLHGDFHARNVLVRGGRLSAVIDWGDLCQGDCATDLACVWMLLPEPRAREQAILRYGVDDALWRRARGWAVFFGAVLLDTGLIDDQRHAAMGEHTLRNLAEGP